MPEAPVRFEIAVTTEADDNELIEATAELLAELKRIEVETANYLMTAEKDSGTKGDVLSTLVIEVLPVFIPSVILFIQAWKLRKSENNTEYGVKFNDLGEISELSVKFNPEFQTQEDIDRALKQLIKLKRDQEQSKDNI